MALSLIFASHCISVAVNLRLPVLWTVVICNSCRFIFMLKTKDPSVVMVVDNNTEPDIFREVAGLII